MNILILSPFYSPNIGGVETHLDDLVSELDARGFRVIVHTYSPITTSGVIWENKSVVGKNSIVYRHKWFGKNLFHFVENRPILDFLYLTPYLCVRVLFFMLFNHKDVDVIHAHGFNAALIGRILKKIFNKRLIVSTHAVYGLNDKSIVSKIIKNILKKADEILCVSKSSMDELINIGLNQRNINVYKQWIDLNNFDIADEFTLIKMRNNMKISDNFFSVLFVGRLIEKKGIKQLCEAAIALPDINFIIIGAGPLENYIKKMAKSYNNILYIGKVINNELNEYFGIANLLCIPSQYEEGFPRVPMEAVACGLPVIASNKGGKGGLTEMLDEDVALFIDPTVDNIKRAILNLSQDKSLYMTLKNNCRNYALRNFSQDNINLIIKYY